VTGGGVRPARDAERALATTTLDALAAEGVAVERVAGDALVAALSCATDDGSR
jgi:hypothetical protein